MTRLPKSDDLAALFLALARLTEAAIVTAGDDTVLQDADRLQAALRELGERRNPHRPTTRAIAERIARLERQLSAMPAGERAAAIRARLGLTKSTYYRVRRVPVPSGTRTRSTSTDAQTRT